MNSGVMNAPLESIARDLGFEGDNVLKGAVVTVMIVGGVIGGVVIGPTSDSIGRRAALGVTTVPLMVGPIISGLSGSLEPMIIGRFLTGIGIGASSALVPLYLSEVRVETLPPEWPFAVQLGSILNHATAQMNHKWPTKRLSISVQ
jgi:MFS family permease